MRPINKRKREMNKKNWQLAFIVCLLAGCSSQKIAEKTDSGLPSWIMNPTASDVEGIAGIACVADSGNLTVDRQAAMANARVALAQQINAKVQAMAETYSRRTDSASGASASTHFETVGRQVTEQNLSGSRVTKADYVTVNGKKQLCTVVEMSVKQRELFNKIVGASGVELDKQQQEVLFEEFKAYKARERMDTVLNAKAPS